MSLDRPAAARHLLRRAAPPAPDGAIVDVTVASAGWEYPDFGAYRLRPGRPVAREADDRERLVLVLEGRAGGPRRGPRLRHPRHADVRVRRPAGADRARRAGPARRGRRGDRGARRRRRPRPAAPFGEPVHRPRRRPRRGARRGPDSAPDPPPAAARRRGRPPDRLRGLHAGRQLVELSAPQARHRGPAASSRGSRSSTTTASPDRRASRSHASTRRTARSTSRWRPGTATSSSSRGATTRSACPRATTATTST